MSDIDSWSALELATALRRGECTAVEVTERALDRCLTQSERVGAFVHVATDLARAEAERADARLGAGDPAPLLGVPCPVKDLSMVAGVPFEAGSAALRGTVAEADDGVTRRLRDAGTVMVGKTTTPEFGFPCYTEPDIAPPARTPWDLSRSAGGSSGGAAAAVAAGLVPLAHGSDGGGSIRIPAAACGLVGLKPSRGRISPGPLGIDGPGLATHGVLTRTVRDTAVGLDVLSRPWPGDVAALPGPVSTYLAACDTPPPPLRIGVLTRPVIVADAPVHAAALSAVERATDVLRGLGHEVAEAPLPFPAERWAAFAAIWSVLALSIPLPPGVGEDSLVPLTRWLRAEGRAVSGVGFFDAVASTQRLARETALAWDEYDVVLTPTLAQPPARLGSLRNDADPARDFADQCAYTPWTSVANLTGRPAISLPVHREEVEGVVLPFGVMLTAPLGADELLLRLAAQVEAADPWAGTLPRPASGVSGGAGR